MAFHQMSIFDDPNESQKPKIIFETFRDDYCRHQMAWLKLDGKDKDAVQACNFKNKKLAESWADWQKCEEANCPFFRDM